MLEYISQFLKFAYSTYLNCIRNYWCCVVLSKTRTKVYLQLRFWWPGPVWKKRHVF